MGFDSTLNSIKSVASEGLAANSGIVQSGGLPTAASAGTTGNLGTANNVPSSGSKINGVPVESTGLAAKALQQQQPQQGAVGGYDVVNGVRLI